ncbi:MAG: N-ethylammeline chlorohydrolase [Candidatus Contendobacter odensis]|uniref:5-methylthioadenosine/S-adenosylhomocysteine deaminase n=1 Tax=Candidatus Contendibacter odensensis TaxID=1400860 RepID=A0A2G6PGC2_9GAMM|nr:MAG: N-ethylammeline chlorohydrolase [Candidatus Contendobacter odensis]
MPQSIDTLLDACWIVPVQPETHILKHHSLVVDKGRILDILPQNEASTRYTATTHLYLDRHVLIPGLVNAHTHASMTLLRGLVDDLPLMTWLQDHIWPAEARWVDPDFIHDGSQLAIAEMLRGGTTCFNDMYFFPEATAETARNCGIRAHVGLIALDFPSAYANNLDDYLEKGLALHDRLKDDPLVRTAFAPHAPYTVSAASLERIGQLSADMNLRIHIHIHETAAEVNQFKTQHGCRPLQRLKQIGLLSHRLLAVHMTQLEHAEIEQLAKAKAHVVHCAESNLKLASGFCPIAQLDNHHVNVAIGTDGAASNNDLDMLGELRTAALLGKGVAGDPAVLPAARTLRMATLNGACALGLEHEIGSLERGKSADIVAIDLGHPETEPVHNPISKLVYAVSRHQVSDVWIAGRRVLADRHLTTLDLTETLERARRWQEKIVAKRHA